MVVQPLGEMVVQPLGEMVVKPLGEMVVQPLGEMVVQPLGEMVVRPKCGTALVFPHSVLHRGRVVTRGTKIILRADVMFRRVDMPEWDVNEESRLLLRDPLFYKVLYFFRESVFASQNNDPDRATALFLKAVEAERQHISYVPTPLTSHSSSSSSVPTPSSVAKTKSSVSARTTSNKTVSLPSILFFSSSVTPHVSVSSLTSLSVTTKAVAPQRHTLSSKPKTKLPPSHVDVKLKPTISKSSLSDGNTNALSGNTNVFSGNTDVFSSNTDVYSSNMGVFSSLAVPGLLQPILQCSKVGAELTLVLCDAVTCIGNGRMPDGVFGLLLSFCDVGGVYALMAASSDCRNQVNRCSLYWEDLYRAQWPAAFALERGIIRREPGTYRAAYARRMREQASSYVERTITAYVKIGSHVIRVGRPVDPRDKRRSPTVQYPAEKSDEEEEAVIDIFDAMPNAGVSEEPEIDQGWTSRPTPAYFIRHGLQHEHVGKFGFLDSVWERNAIERASNDKPKSLELALHVTAEKQHTESLELFVDRISRPHMVRPRNFVFTSFAPQPTLKHLGQALQQIIYERFGITGARVQFAHPAVLTSLAHCALDHYATAQATRLVLHIGHCPQNAYLCAVTGVARVIAQVGICAQTREDKSSSIRTCETAEPESKSETKTDSSQTPQKDANVDMLKYSKDSEDRIATLLFRQDFEEGDSEMVVTGTKGWESGRLGFLKTSSSFSPRAVPGEALPSLTTSSTTGNKKQRVDVIREPKLVVESVPVTAPHPDDILRMYSPEPVRFGDTVKFARSWTNEEIN
jgi:hypothetical protein